MRINFITHNNNIVFQKIQLENEENRTATELLNTLYNDEAKAETAKSDLFNIYDKHITKEVAGRSKHYVNKDDYLQNIYLSFFELLDKIQKNVLLPCNFLTELNENIRRDGLAKNSNDYSLDKKKRDCSRTYADDLTEDDF